MKTMIDEIGEALRGTDNNWYALAEIIWGNQVDLCSMNPDIWQSILINFCADEGIRVLDIPYISPATLKRLISLPSTGIFNTVFPRL